MTPEATGLPARGRGFGEGSSGGADLARHRHVAPEYGRFGPRGATPHFGSGAPEHDGPTRVGESAPSASAELFREATAASGGTVALDMDRTLAAIAAAATDRRFLSYGDIAAASGVAWVQARRPLDPHLFDLCRYATARGWPLLSAIVVDRRSVAHGAMRGRPLIGFARAAARCGFVVGPDAVAFLAEEQARVFDWAAKERRT